MLSVAVAFYVNCLIFQNTYSIDSMENWRPDHAPKANTVAIILSFHH